MAMRCPACRTMTLQPFKDSTVGLEIDSCTACDGLWFDAHELATFLKSDLMKKRFLHVQSEPLESVGFVINTDRRKCPRDRSIMDERMFAGITLDLCTTCQGWWFDAGEVRHIVEKFNIGAGDGDLVIANELRMGLDGDAKKANLLAQLMSFFRQATGKN